MKNQSVMDSNVGNRLALTSRLIKFVCVRVGLLAGGREPASVALAQCVNSELCATREAKVRERLLKKVEFSWK